MTLDEIASGFEILTGFPLTEDGIRTMAGKDLKSLLSQIPQIVEGGSGDGDDADNVLIRALLRQAPGLVEDDGLYAYTHDPQAIADALGDPPEIAGWQEVVERYVARL